MCCITDLWFKLGVLLAGLSAACGVLIYLAPDLTLKIAGYLVHSTIEFKIKPFDLVEFIIGLVLWGLIGTIIGFIFTKICDNECKKY
ncbi:hypothetical protein HYT84_03040 [Candidatus Micrarchaeota archaeon]|nr:hypothetical protein [Candidatus Micrarchaeota archaeon]